MQDAVPGIFYPKLWELSPKTKPLFSKTTVDEQGKKLVKTLNVAVQGLNDLDALVPKLDALARRHAYYNVTDGAQLHLMRCHVLLIARAHDGGCDGSGAPT